MKKARYIDEDGNNSEVSSDDITPESNDETYKGHLLCEDKECNAKVFYVERQNPKLNRYFSTYPGSLHRKGCINEYNHDGNRKAFFLVRGEGSNVSDDHIMRTLKDSYSSYKNDLNPEGKKKKSNNQKGKTKRIKKVPLTDDGSDMVAATKESPSTNGIDVQVGDEKEPNIHRNEVSRMKVNKDEPFKEVHGLVDEIYENKGEIYWYIRGTQGGKCKVYFGNPFETVHPQEYGLLRLVRDYIKDGLKNNKRIQFHCFGELKEDQTGISVEIYSYRHIYMDGHSFYDIINLVNGFK